MDWLREWIMQLAGIIAVGAIVDIIMIDGEMKKYIKPVLGFVLIVAVIRPITGLSQHAADINIAENSFVETSAFYEEIDEKERQTVLSLYEHNLEEKVKDELKDMAQGSPQVRVTAETKEDNFGAVKNIQITFFCAKNEMLDAEKIKKDISQKFGVSDKNVAVLTQER